MAILGNLWSFWHIKKGLKTDVFKPAGRGIRTSPVTKIKDFEQVPENLVTRKLLIRTSRNTCKIIDFEYFGEPWRSQALPARLNDSSNPYLLLSKKKTDIRVDVCFLLAEV